MTRRTLVFVWSTTSSSSTYAVTLDRIEDQHRAQRQREQPVGDRRADLGCRGTLGVDVDPVTVAADLGERVDPILRDVVPRADAQLLEAVDDTSSRRALVQRRR